VADDLIPPPSPAGRPAPDAPQPRAREDERPSLFRPVEEDDRPEPEPEEPRDAPPAAGPVGPSPYRSRFGFVLGALIGVGIATVGVLVGVMAGGSSSTAPANWSPWRPTADDGFAAARQIAEHVGRKYRLGNGDQLVAVRAGPLEVADIPLAGIALRTAPVGGDIQLLEGKHGVMYTLNGLGQFGAIEEGKPSERRHRLLRREALELALYTFRYVEDVDMVVALLPPAPPDEKKPPPAGTRPTTHALFFRPGDLAPELDRPLHATIPSRTPRPETFTGAEADAIEGITRPNLFEASFQQGQDAHAFLVLARTSG
jgi:hypothetical protein